MKAIVLIGVVAISIAQSSLVASYSFSGNAEDNSDNGHDGTVFGAQLTTDRFGNANSAYAFDGVDDFINIPKIGLSGSVSVSGWYYDTAPHPNHVALLGQATSYSERWVLGGSQPEVFWYDRRGSDNNPYNVMLDLELNHWYFVTAVITSDPSAALKVKYYLDGQLLANLSTKGFQEIDADYQIGKFYGEYGWAYSNGRVDDLNIYDHELNESEISELYHAQAVPEPGSLVLLAGGLIVLGLVSKAATNSKGLKSKS